MLKVNFYISKIFIVVACIIMILTIGADLGLKPFTLYEPSSYVKEVGVFLMVIGGVMALACYLLKKQDV